LQDSVIVGYADINQRVLDKSPCLKIVCNHGVDVDNIDLDAAQKNNVWVRRVESGPRWLEAKYMARH
jgi:D-3-phosphoglycerate dehydrogenase